jgi:predicted transcriptional regulator of viral defense system
MSAHSSKPLRPRNFFARHPVFTHTEFVTAHTAGGRSEHTSNSLLAKHAAGGRLLRVRRGLYATVPDGVDPREFSPDPYLVATRLRDGAVVAYHAALAFHGKAYSDWRRMQYMTAERARPFAFRGVEYLAVQAPPSVRDLPEFGGGVKVRPHADGEARVASLERCLVDLLHAPQHGGGWEEIWRSLEMVEFFDLDAVVEYTLRLRTALTVARVGFFLEQHREEWMVEEKHLEAHARKAPAQPRYLDPHRESGKLVARWNLVVSEHVLQRRWEEPR